MSAVAHRLAALVVAGAFVFVALAAGAVPAGTAALSGRLIDAETGAPVQAAELSLPDLGQRASSDTEGAFAFAALPAEPFTLVVSHLGYEARVLVVDPAAQGETPLVLRLRPIYYRGEKVVVSASRYGPELHLTQTNLTGEQIAARAAEKDLPLLLESTPGVYATSDAGNGVGYTALKLRGFDQKRIGVMINGIPLNDPEDHQVYWVDMPDLAASLADVQIQRGVTNSLGGMSAIAGSVNLVTEVLGDERGGRLQLAGGSFGTARQSLAWQSGLLGGRFAMGARISHLASDGYRERSGSDQWGVFWSGRYLTPASSTQVNIYSGRERTHQAWYGLSERALIENRRGNPETYANAVDDFRQPHYELHHRWTLRENLEWASSLYWIHGEGFYENFKADADPVAFGLDTALGVPDSVPRDLVRRKWVDKDQRGLLRRVTWTKGPSRLILGGDAYDFQSRHWGDLQFVEGFASDAAVFLPPYHEYTGDKSVWSVYANEQFALGWGLSALVDLHFQHKQYDFFQQATGNFP
ncbi:TonB-dependent receptor, partial [bacterium]|nr:TonB-dependent receptor [bacterium]